MSPASLPVEWSVEVPGGRRVGGVRLGPEDGRRALFVHGAPASAENVRYLDLGGDGADRAGVALVAIDRPGIGATDPLGERPPEEAAGGAAAATGAAAAADDMAAAMDALGWPSATVVVHSAGAFAAVTMAARHPDRVERLVMIAAAAPDMSGADAAEMDPQARSFFDLCRDRPRAAAMMLGSMRLMLRVAPNTLLRSAARSLPPADAELVADRAAATAFVAMLRRALRHGPAGAIRDGAVARGPWPVDAAAIRCAVDLYAGDQDRNVPPAVAEAWVERLPGTTLHPVAGAGHVSILPRVADRVLASVA